MSEEVVLLFAVLGVIWATSQFMKLLEKIDGNY